MPFGTREARTFPVVVMGCDVETWTVETTDDDARVGGGALSREDTMEGESSCEKEAVSWRRKSKCSWAAERFVRMSVCSSDVGSEESRRAVYRSTAVSEFSTSVVLHKYG